jgi:hypothetical protein
MHCRRAREGWRVLWVCANTPELPGRIVRVQPTATCPNFARRRGPAAWCKLPPAPDPETRYIALTRGLFAVVDAWNFERLNRCKWSTLIAGHTCYAMRQKGHRTILMHREIMHPPPGMVVDHINGNGLTNREYNLRVCTQAQNGYNRMPCARGHSSRHKGIYWCRAARKWCAMIGFNHRNIYLGVFADEDEAARARDRKAVELHGIYAYLNFPEDRPKYRAELQAASQPQGTSDERRETA